MVDRVVERKDDFQSVFVQALPTLVLVHGLADGKTLPGKERLAVIVGRVDDKRVAFPMADGVSHVLRIDLGPKFPALRPNFAPIVVILEVLHQPVASRKNFKWARSKKIARHAKRIAI